MFSQGCGIQQSCVAELASELSLLCDEEANAISFPGFVQLNDVWMVLRDKTESLLGRKGVSINQVLFLILGLAKVKSFKTSLIQKFFTVKSKGQSDRVENLQESSKC